VDAVRLDGITKTFGSTVAISDVSFTVREGELVSLLGPSGCGKTTVLRCIAGYIPPDEGRIFLNGTEVTTMQPYHRDIGMVFQSYALFPHMSVEQNVAFGLRMRHIAKPEIRERVAEGLRLVDLQGFERRRTNELSGGQQQRVALARAIVIRPRLLLLDEPLSNLDAKLRRSMQIEIRALQEALRITTILVTHDQAEALSLSDRVIVMNKGRIQQVGTPTEIYAGPTTTFVADFIGDSNLLKGRLTTSVSASEITVTLNTGEQLRIEKPARASPIDSQVTVLARPEAILVLAAGAPSSDHNAFEATVSRLVYHGASETLLLQLASGLTLIAERQLGGSSAKVTPGEKVLVQVPPASLSLLFN
jgi:spermidine/putrescine ABC transporter ATP-binding subunit